MRGVRVLYQQGIEQGIAQGIEQGIAKEKLEIAVKMLGKEFSDEVILSLGITKEQLAEAKESCGVKA